MASYRTFPPVRPMGDVAFASGFSSVRRFKHLFGSRYGLGFPSSGLGTSRRCTTSTRLPLCLQSVAGELWSPTAAPVVTVGVERAMEDTDAKVRRHPGALPGRHGYVETPPVSARREFALHRASLCVHLVERLLDVLYLLTGNAIKVALLLWSK